MSSTVFSFYSTSRAGPAGSTSALFPLSFEKFERRCLELWGCSGKEARMLPYGA
jgi:hypothetical protein